MSNVAPEDWVTESGVAKRLEMKHQAVSLWTNSMSFDTSWTDVDGLLILSSKLLHFID